MCELRAELWVCDLVEEEVLVYMLVLCAILLIVTSFLQLQIPNQIPLVIRILHLFDDSDSHCQSSEYLSLKETIFYGSISVFNQICEKNNVCTAPLLSEYIIIFIVKSDIDN